MKYEIKCPYCGNSYITEADKLKCSGCGAQNGMEHAVRVIEDADERKKQADNRREEQMHQQRIKESNARIENQKINTRAKIIFPIIVLAFFAVSFVGCAGCALISAVSSTYVDLQSELMMERQRAEEEARWYDKEEVKRVLPTITDFVKALENKDYSGMIETMYMPEGSYALEKSLEKAIGNSELSSLLGKVNEIQKVKYIGKNEKGEYYEVTIDDNTYEMILRIVNGDWGIILETAFFYNYVLCIPSDCTVYLNDIELNSNTVTSHEIKLTEYTLYTIPAIAKGEYTAKIETAFGTYTERYQPSQDTLDTYGGWDPVFKADTMISWNKEACAFVNDVWMQMTKLYLDGADVSQARQYFTDDISDDRIKKCFDVIDTYVNNEYYGAMHHYRIGEEKILDAKFASYDSAICVISARAIVEYNDHTKDNRLRTTIGMKYTEDGWKIYYLPDDALFDLGIAYSDIW